MKKIFWIIFAVLTLSACGEEPIVALRPISNDPRVYCGEGTVEEDGFCVAIEEDDAEVADNTVEILKINIVEIPSPEPETVVVEHDADGFAVMAEDDEEVEVQEGQKEICDNMDNDGDGEVDEEDDLYSPMGFFCAVSTEGVWKQGRYVCVPDNFGHAYFQCQLDCQPEEDACDDGIDNNCDGEVDEGCDALQVSLNAASPQGALVSGTDSTVMVFDLYARNTEVHFVQWHLLLEGTCGAGYVTIKDGDGNTIAGPATKSATGDVYFGDYAIMDYDSVGRYSIHLDTTDCVHSGDWVRSTIVGIEIEENIPVENVPLTGNLLMKP